MIVFNYLLDSQGAPRNWKAYLPELKQDLVYWMISHGGQAKGNPLRGNIFR